MFIAIETQKEEKVSDTKTVQVNNQFAKELVVTRLCYLGVGIISLTTLLYETLLTRIFSVFMWYHFAFMAISIAMFGMTVGAMLVYLLPSFQRREKIFYHLSLSALLFALAILGSLIFQLKFNFQFRFHL